MRVGAAPSFLPCERSIWAASMSSLLQKQAEKKFGQVRTQTKSLVRQQIHVDCLLLTGHDKYWECDTVRAQS